MKEILLKKKKIFFFLSIIINFSKIYVIKYFMRKYVSREKSLNAFDTSSIVDVLSDT